MLVVLTDNGEGEEFLLACGHLHRTHSVNKDLTFCVHCWTASGNLQTRQNVF